jgi:hypothetical protein
MSRDILRIAAAMPVVAAFDAGASTSSPWQRPASAPAPADNRVTAARVSAASREQSMRAGQVTSAMSEINSGTQRNADMVSQAAASTETLRSEARALMASVSEFGHQNEAAAA